MLEHLDGFRRHLEARRSLRTARAYSAHAAAFLNALGVDAPTKTAVEAFLDRTRRDGGRRAASTRNQELAALRAFFAFAGASSPGSQDPTAGIDFLRGAAKDPVHLDRAELERLFLAAAGEASAPADRIRNVLLVALLAHLGLRVHELVALDVGQVDLASTTLVAVRGKGGTVHDLPLNSGLVTLLGRWLARRDQLAVAGDVALFLSGRGTRLGVRSVQRLLVTLREAIGTAKRLTPHSLRHTTATLALSMGVEVDAVCELLRHQDMNTTRRYLHLVDTRRREAVRRLGTTLPEGLLELGAEPRDRLGVVRQITSAPPANKVDPPLDAQGKLDDAA